MGSMLQDSVRKVMKSSHVHVRESQHTSSSGNKWRSASLRHDFDTREHAQSTAQSLTEKRLKEAQSIINRITSSLKDLFRMFRDLERIQTFRHCEALWKLSDVPICVTSFVCQIDISTKTVYCDYYYQIIKASQLQRIGTHVRGFCTRSTRLKTCKLWTSTGKSHLSRVTAMTSHWSQSDCDCLSIFKLLAFQ